MDEEKRRLQSTREEVGDSSGGRRIDLESGTVTISRRGTNAPPPAESAEAEPTESDQAEAESDLAEAESDQAESDETAAASATGESEAAGAGEQR